MKPWLWQLKDALDLHLISLYYLGICNEFTVNQLDVKVIRGATITHFMGNTFIYITMGYYHFS
jgi:hypothetical protein